MEGFSAENAQAIVGDRDKVPENTHFVTLELDCITPGQQIPGTTTGYSIGAGTSRVTVAPRNVEQVESMLEDPTRIQTAKDLFESDIDAELAERYGRLFSQYAKRGEFTVDDAREARERYAKSPGSPSEGDRKIHEHRQMVYDTTSSSWQAVFQRLFHRGVRPLTRVEVIDTKVEHPENARKARYEAESAARTAQILREALGDTTKSKRSAAS